MAVLLSPVLVTAFSNNPLLNGLIMLVLLLGIFWNLRQVLRLSPPRSAGWRGFSKAVCGSKACRRRGYWHRWRACWRRATARTRDGQERFTLSSTATRSLLDSLASRLDESRELSRYMTGLLIFLGLLRHLLGLAAHGGSDLRRDRRDECRVRRH